MSWWDDVSEMASGAWDGAVESGNSYITDAFTEQTSDAPTVVAQQIQQPAINGAGQMFSGLNDGIAGFSWTTLAAIATVLGLVFMLIKGRK